MLSVFIGYDERESQCFHVLEQSIMDTCSQPVAIIPLHGRMLRNFDGQRDGTNRFIYSRFLVPYLMDYQDWAIFLDADMLVRTDLSRLWDLRDESKAVMVVKHEYETKATTKLVGTPMEAKNESYPRKNWSSMVLWNCAHPGHRILTPEFVSEAPGSYLHRFSWIPNDDIGEVPLEWNHLVGEYPQNKGAHIAHFTLGAPGFAHYSFCEHSNEYHAKTARVNRMDDLIDIRKGAA